MTFFREWSWLMTMFFFPKDLSKGLGDVSRSSMTWLDLLNFLTWLKLLNFLSWLGLLADLLDFTFLTYLFDLHTSLNLTYLWIWHFTYTSPESFTWKTSPERLHLRVHFERLHLKIHSRGSLVICSFWCSLHKKTKTVFKLSVGYSGKLTII